MIRPPESRSREKSGMTFLSYWGKAAAEVEGGVDYHPLAYHSLDVAAVAEALLERDALLRQRMFQAARDGGLLNDEQSVCRTLVFLIALHDLGKFSDRFQYLRPDVAQRLGVGRSGKHYEFRHDAMGLDLLIQGRVLDELVQSGDVFASQDDKKLTGQDAEGPYVPWLRAITGHHGAPTEAIPHFNGQVGPADRQAALEFSRSAAKFLGGARLEFSGVESVDSALKRSSWLVAGLAVMADWIGSNREWFPYERDTRTPEAYWLEIARVRANEAVEKTGVLPRAIASFPGVASLFTDSAPSSPFVPTPLQQATENLEVDSQPQLFVLEDQTGAGKTEAALTLVHRLLEAKAADGLFFALPTMATANAMHARLERVYRRFFEPEPEPAPAFVLAHSESRTVLAGLAQARRAPDYSQGEPEIATDLSTWISDGPKKALLAHVGVGTIDQALMGALRAKHSTLRLLGLHRHVLVVDEVHACDAYVAKTLETLLELQSSLGGSAILLSATLPAALRARFVDAFQRGRPALRKRTPRAETTAYPLITRVTGSSEEHLPCDPSPGLGRRVPVGWLESTDAVEARVVAEAKAGRCVCWVRNTVREALESFDRLVAQLDKNQVDLFHARFLLGDRLTIERDVVSRFGKNSTTAQRRGRVLVATQVVEQSLDIDFDVMVSDLAPIDLLIQRAGRLQRHKREQRAPAELLVLAPAWTDTPDAKWLSSALQGTSRVYPDAVALWRTQRVLRQREGLRLPAEARLLIEAVYGDKSEVPEGLASIGRRAEDGRSADRGVAAFAGVKVAQGYHPDGFVWMDGNSPPTRLGEATTRLRFVVPDGNRLRPFNKAGALSWSLSSLRVRAAQFGEATNGDQTAQVAKITEDMADRGKGCQTVVVHSQSDSTWLGKGLDLKKHPVDVRYDRKRGLVLKHSE